MPMSIFIAEKSYCCSRKSETQPIKTGKHALVNYPQYTKRAFTMKTYSCIMGCFLLLLLMHVSYALQAQKKQRVKNITDYTIVRNDTITESITFYYSGNRGSQFDVNASEYGFSYYLNLFYYDYYSIGQMPMLPEINNRRPLGILFDSAHRYSDLNPNNQYTEGIYFVHYISDTLVEQWAELYNNSQNLYNTNISYNDFGKPIWICTVLVDTPTKEDTTILTKFNYNTNHSLQSDSIFYKNPMVDYFRDYTYDTSAPQYPVLTDLHYTSSQQQNTLNHFTYNKDGKPILIEQTQFYNNVWNNWGHHNLEWDAGGHLTSYQLFSSNDKPFWVYETVYDMNGDPVSRTTKEYDANGSTRDCIQTYFYINSYHNPDSIVTYAHDCSSSYESQAITIYTYETYGNDTVVTNHHPFIYPNPAHNVVHVRWNKDYSKQPLAIKLYNATGQEMRNYNITKPHATDDFNTQGLAAGVYLLRINTADGNEYIYSGKLVIL
jgi:hypothetical protein